MTLVYWNESVVKVPIERARLMASADTLASTKQLAPNHYTATFTTGRMGLGGKTVGIKGVGKMVHIRIGGAQPHDIVPKDRSTPTGRPPALKFPSGDFAPVVKHHPGVEGDPFVDKGAATFPAHFARRGRQAFPG